MTVGRALDGIVSQGERGANEMRAKKDSALPPPLRVSGQVGLCESCRHARRIESDRGSTFYLCELSSCDPRFPKYPALPVIQCLGYSPKT